MRRMLQNVLIREAVRFPEAHDERLYGESWVLA